MYKKNLISKIRKSTALVLSAVLMFSMAACGKENVKGSINDKTTEAAVTTEADSHEDTEEITTEDMSQYKEDPEEQAKFDEFLDRYYKAEVTTDTISYNYSVKDGEAMGIEEPEVSLGDTDMSDEAVAADRKKYADFKAELEGFSYKALTADQRLTYDMLDEYLTVTDMEYDNIYLMEPFSPMKGLQANLATNFTDYRFDDKGDVERYIQLINMVPDYFNSYLDFEKVKSEKGYFMSDDVCDQVIEQCDTFLEKTDDHFMITVFDSNIDALDFLTDEEKADFKAQNKEAVLNSLLPAYQNVKDVLTSLKGTGQNDLGICYYDGGKDYYEYLLKYYTGTEKTPEEVINMLDDNLNQLFIDMYALYGENQEAYEYFVENSDTLFSTEGMTSKEIIDELMSKNARNYPDFKNIEYDVDNLDPAMESILENTLAYYMAPAYDDQDHNIIRVNGAHADSGLWTTLAHEGCPGHMFQNAYYMSLNPNPVRTLYNFLGYKEGWAMYACYDSIGSYEFDNPEYADVLTKLYKINDEIGYLATGRVDIGVHYEGWSVDDVADYLNKSGLNGEIAQDIFDSIIGDPAVYQSYSTGYYEMAELEEYAERQLGDDFDLKEFNTVILKTGPIQYDILKREVKKYIAEKKAD